MWSGWGGKLIVVSVVLSTVATFETTLMQVTRTLFSRGHDNTLPRALGKVHAERKTPLVAIATVTVISLVLLILS